MNFGRRNILTGMAAMPLLAAADPFEDVLIFEAGRIVTMEPAMPIARFVAVANGMILGVASSLDALAPWTRGRNVSIDRRFANKVLMPGLIEPHLHPAQASVMLNLPYVAPEDWDLPSGRFKGAQTPDAWRARFLEELARSSDTPFICWGYHELFHGPLDRAALDQLVPDRPVIVWQRSFHDVILNSAAMKDWGFETKAPFEAALSVIKADPGHADFERGHFSETALPLALEKMRPAILGPERMRTGMARLARMFLTSGVTTASDMATGIMAGFEAEAAIIKASFNKPENPARIMLMPFATAFSAGDDLGQWLKDAQSRHVGKNVGLDKRVKLLADGAFFAQNMRMNPPGYSDGHEGKWITPPDILADQASRFWNAGFSLHIHVNGDEGLDVVLGVIEALPIRRGQSVTLEHLGYSTESQNERIARLGLMVSAQPNYIRVLGDAYGRNGLGPDRAAAINRLGSLERKGVPLGLHSDFNMAPVNPIYLAWIAANRQTIGGTVKAPAERLSLEKALRAITIEAAQVIGMDHLVGSIASGKKADFAVVDRDPFSLGAERLRDLHIEGVIYEGRFTPV